VVSQHYRQRAHGSPTSGAPQTAQLRMAAMFIAPFCSDPGDPDGLSGQRIVVNVLPRDQLVG
jgi:hypothetical protein